MPKALRHIDEKQTSTGLQRMAERSVVICGIARDCATALQNLIPQIEKLGACFSRYQVIAVENDSRDQTGQLLDEWSKRNRHVTPIRYSEPGKKERTVKTGWFSTQRIERICVARNHYLEAIEERDADFVIVMDLDILEFSLKGLAASFSESESWHVSAGNGIRYTLRAPLRKHVYWDTYAYEPLNGFPNGVQTLKALRREQRALATRLDSGTPLQARAAFGGLCVYRYASLSGLRYRALPNDDPNIPVLCEHVALHRDMHERNRQTKLVINPAQQVRYERLGETLRRTIGQRLR